MHLTQTRLSAISIHTPHAGSDPHNGVDAMDDLISIHTPHAGSDQKAAEIEDKSADFNPHSPCGERLVSYAVDSTEGDAFQSTLPMRGATPS